MFSLVLTMKSEKTNPYKKAKRPFCKSLRDYFREYCVCSSIHGFRYFGEKRTYFERGWWFVVFSLTLSACIFFIYQVYLKWDNSPVIVSFATDETQIHEIPFPAITICPESKSMRSIYNHKLMVDKMKKNEKFTADEAKNFEYMSLICNGLNGEEYKNWTGQKFTDVDFFQKLQTISELYPTPIFRCVYLNKKFNCSDFFTKIFTDEGLCYTYNMLDRGEIYNDIVNHYSDFHKAKPKAWSIDDGYSKDAALNPYPRRALLAGASNALVIYLRTTQKNIDYSCKESQQGFRVTLHTPMRIPRPSQQYFQVPLNREVIAAIHPIIVRTSNTAKKYSPKKLKCFLPNDRILKFFKIYTQLNCKLECLANFTLEQCGCVNFYMPRDNQTKICGSAKLECMKRAEHDLLLGDLSKLLDRHKKNSNKKQDKVRQKRDADLSADSHKGCGCRPICNDLTYDVETSQAKFDWNEVVQDQSKQRKSYISKLVIYFKTSQFVTSERHELFGPTDFLGNFGGLLGLFTGFSVLSIMEIIYFLTVRLFCNRRLYGSYAGKGT